MLEWRSETDAEGRFLWDGAPGDRVLMGIGKDGSSEDGGSRGRFARLPANRWRAQR